MNCKPLRWLWGLLPLALIGYLVNYSARPMVEADLKSRGEAALKAAGLPWAGLTFEGRDGVLSGLAYDEGARGRAMDIIHSTWGVRVVDDRASLVELTDNFFWLATRESGRIRIKGFVPNDELRKTIIGMASASFPGHEIDDRMKLARGGPPDDVWLGGVNFGFRQLGQLKSGRARLDAADFTIVGEAADIESYNKIDMALNERIPKGIKLRSRNILAPKVSPFTWSADIHGSQLVMRGYVPSSGMRAQLLKDARKKFPKLTVVDNLTIAGGAPKGWLTGTGIALAALNRLGNGRASMTDTNVSLMGSTKNAVLSGSIDEMLSSGLPEGYGRKIDIAYLKPKPLKLDWRAVMQNGSIILEGEVPDRATQKLFVDKARTAFPGRRVVNRMNVKSGVAPDGWTDTAGRALELMTRLAEGEVTLNDKTLRVSGVARDANSVETIRETVTSYLPDGYSGHEFVKPPVQEFNSYDFTETEEEGDSYWRKQVAALKKKEEIAKKPVTANVCEKMLNEVAKTGIVRFETNSADIKPVSFPTLNKLAEVANSCPDAKVEISGHTDSDGSAKYNQKLSLMRARSITTYLVKQGVGASRLTSAGYGETRPIAPNNTDENKARNRRIEFKITANNAKTE